MSFIRSSDIPTSICGRALLLLLILCGIFIAICFTILIYLSLQPKPEYIIPEHIMDLKKYHRSGLCPSHSPSKECPDYRICDKDFDCLYNFKCCKGCCVRAKRPSNQFKFKASGEVKSAEKFSFH